MSYEIIITDPFEKQTKKLKKKYRSLKNDLANLIESLEENPTQGVQIKENCYKIRMAISSKGRGKSGGARVITFVQIVNENVYLLDIYDKKDKSNISEKELEALIDWVEEEIDNDIKEEEE